ncbi:MAG: deoxyhypusine synthase [bacterium]
MTPVRWKDIRKRGEGIMAKKKASKAKKTGSKYKGKRIFPAPIRGGDRVDGLVDGHFNAFNAGRLREICELLATKILCDENVTVGLSVSGALTPAGLGMSAVVPLMKAGFVDWIVSTGANLYHDAHFGLDYCLHRGSLYFDDTELKKEKVVRIFDITMDYQMLRDTDEFFRRILVAPEFRGSMGTAELHYRIGKYLHEREKTLCVPGASILAAGYELGIPIYTSSPGDSSIGLNIAELEMMTTPSVRVNVSLDVNETAAIVLDAKRGGGRSAVLILGGGSPKNFILQTEPQIQDILGIEEKGHDYFMQLTDARPDTGGLSGATPSEAVTWGKVDPNMLPDAIVCYTDVSIALPIITSYVLSKVKKRGQKRLFDRRAQMAGRLRDEFLEARRKRVGKTGKKK